MQLCRQIPEVLKHSSTACKCPDNLSTQACGHEKAQPRHSLPDKCACTKAQPRHRRLVKNVPPLTEADPRARSNSPPHAARRQRHTRLVAQCSGWMNPSRNRTNTQQTPPERVPNGSRFGSASRPSTGFADGRLHRPSSALRRPARGKNVGSRLKTLALMRDYGRARDPPRRGSPPSATISTVAAISFSRTALMS
jgi:hypothetical protein